jgi:flavin-dependent dehydrogenase
MHMHTIQNRPDYDVIIVGARCAGAATARLLAERGARVLCVDRSARGSDTLSTSYLMRGAVLQLHRWGVLPKLVAAGTPAVRSTFFHYENRSLKVAIRPSLGTDALYAPRRTLLDPLLVAAARDAGAEVRFGVRVLGVLRDADGRVRGIEMAEGHAHPVRIMAPLVIGADGLPSSIARWVDAPTYRVGRHSAPTIYSYFEGLPAEIYGSAYHWYYAHGMAAGIAPTNDGAYTVFVGGPAELLPELHGDRQAGMLRVARALSPLFGDALSAARRVSSLRAFAGVRGYYRRPFGPGWALVGDAGYFRDPNTAHGISDALRDAELLAQAIARGTEDALVDYQRKRDAASERLFEASDEISGGQWDTQRIEQLLLDAAEGMRDGVRAVQALDQEIEISSAFQSDSIGVPISRLATRTDSRSGV